MDGFGGGPKGALVVAVFASVDSLVVGAGRRQHGVQRRYGGLDGRDGRDCQGRYSRCALSAVSTLTGSAAGAVSVIVRPEGHDDTGGKQHDAWRAGAGGGQEGEDVQRAIGGCDDDTYLQVCLGGTSSRYPWGWT